MNYSNTFNNSTNSTNKVTTMTNLISGIECNNEEATFIHSSLFSNLKKTGETCQSATYVQHLKEVCNELKLVQMQYFIQPMMEDFPVGKVELIDKEELLSLVHSYNIGTLGHCDSWFTLTTVGGMELEISDYYEEAQIWYNAQPTNSNSNSNL